MGIYHTTTVGVGFEVPLEAIRALPTYGEAGEVAEEALDIFLYTGDYSKLSYATAHEYDAEDDETQYVVCIDRLTYGDHETFDLVVLDGDPIELTDEETGQIDRVQFILGIDTPVVRFVASSLS